MESFSGQEALLNLESHGLCYMIYQVLGGGFHFKFFIVTKFFLSFSLLNIRHCNFIYPIIISVSNRLKYSFC